MTYLGVFLHAGFIFGTLFTQFERGGGFFGTLSPFSALFSLNSVRMGVKTCNQMPKIGPIFSLAHFRAELGQKSVKNELSVQKNPQNMYFPWILSVRIAYYRA